jgi:iron complex transport system substrate-binding protein
MSKFDEFDELSRVVVDSAYKIHFALGPGLLESAYESLLFQSLRRKGLKVERQKSLCFVFEGTSVSDGLRIDLLVDNALVVEIKSIERLAPLHAKQVLTYLRALDLRVGLLINFGGATLKEGLRRIVNGYSPKNIAAHEEPPSRLR